MSKFSKERYLSKNRTKRFGPGRTKDVWDKTGGKCWYCGIDLLPPPQDGKKVTSKHIDRIYTLDHLRPKSRGGTNQVNNLVPSCRRCNNLKADNTTEFLRMRVLFMRKNWPKFNHIQFDFLFNRGINLGRLETHVFYFEKEGLK